MVYSILIKYEMFLSNINDYMISILNLPNLSAWEGCVTKVIFFQPKFSWFEIRMFLSFSPVAIPRLKNKACSKIYS